MPSDAYSNMQKERNELKPLLSKKEPELKDWENSQSVHIAKTRKHVLKRTLRVWSNNFLIGRLV